MNKVGKRTEVSPLTKGLTERKPDGVLSSYSDNVCSWLSYCFVPQFRCEWVKKWVREDQAHYMELDNFSKMHLEIWALSRFLGSKRPKYYDVAKTRNVKRLEGCAFVVNHIFCKDSELLTKENVHGF